MKTSGNILPTKRTNAVFFLKPLTLHTTCFFRVWSFFLFFFVFGVFFRTMNWWKKSRHRQKISYYRRQYQSTVHPKMQPTKCYPDRMFHFFPFFFFFSETFVGKLWDINFFFKKKTWYLSEIHFPLVFCSAFFSFFFLPVRILGTKESISP